MRIIVGVQARAQIFDYLPHLAAAGIALGFAQQNVGRYEDAVAALEEAYCLGLSSDLDAAIEAEHGARWGQRR